MKKYVKVALKKLIESDKLKIEVKLNKKNDYKKCLCRLIYNKLILTAQMKIVPSHIKNAILRTTGMNVGHDACVPHDITMDAYFPELIYLGKGIIIGGESRLVTHEIKGNKLILGKNILKDRCLMGGLSVMKPGSAISKNSILNMTSELESEMPEGELWGGKPAKLMMQFSKDDIEKFFKPSEGNYKQYYKDFKKKVKEFMKDPDQNYLKIYYNGKRLNAGNDWHKARNIFRIWYNGIIIETTRRLPHCFLKTLLLRMAGVKIGKNVKIGYGCVFDHIYCDTITVEDNAVLDKYVYIDGHEYTITQTVFGKTKIGKGAHLKKHVYVRTSTQIGENAVIEPNSQAQRVIPANEVWGGMPAKFVRKIE
ncbi:MAG: hypothetical protein ABII01_00965 [Candidatus Woesearchaeota archaeon]